MLSTPVLERGLGTTRLSKVRFVIEKVNTKTKMELETLRNNLGWEEDGGRREGRKRERELM